MVDAVNLDVDTPIGFTSTGVDVKATPYFEDYLFALLSRTGGEATNIADDAFIASAESDQLPYYFGLIKELIINNGYTTTVKTSNYTAKNREYVEGRNSITVKLPSNPQRSYEVIVANGDGSGITVDGNGNNIKFNTTDKTFVTRNKGSSYHFHYFIDTETNSSYWRIR